MNQNDYRPIHWTVIYALLLSGWLFGLEGFGGFLLMTGLFLVVVALILDSEDSKRSK